MSTLYVKILAAAALVLAATTLRAQNTFRITGTVTDAATGQPVAGVVVKLTDAAGEIAAYDTTDDKGAYTILRTRKPEEGYTLVFSMLGYATCTVTPADWSAPADAVMEAAATAIREVVVKAPRISMQGDTLSYNASSFTDADDKTLSDILKKMPGIEVEESGRVKYQGEAINKLYIDGVDMLGDRYALATKNISPQDIKSVDVMENHQPKKILRDVEFSDKAALNIRMDERTRNQWSGSATAAGGFSPALWNGSLFAMCLGKRFSTINSLKSNNTGSDIGAETGITGTGAGYALPQYISIGTTAAPIGRLRTRFNTSHLVNTANMLRLGEDYTLNIDASYLYERLTSDNASATTYYVGEDSISTHSAARAADASHTVDLSLRLLANTDRTYLNNTLTARIVRRDVWRSDEGTYPNMQRGDLPSQSIDDRLELTKRFGRRTFTLRSENGFGRTPQTLSVEREGSQQLQTIDVWAFRSATNTSVTWRFGRWGIGLNGAFTQIVRSLRSSLTGLGDTAGATDTTDPTADIQTDIQTDNNLRLALSQVDLYPSFTYDSPVVKLSLRIPLSGYFYSIADHMAADTRRRFDDFTFSPLLSVKVIATPMLSLSASASYNRAPLDEQNFYTGAILSDYRYLRRGYEILDNDASASFSAGFDYKNPLSSIFANVTAGHTRSHLNAVSSQDFVGDYIVTTAVAAPYDTSSTYVSGGVSKGIDALKGKVGILVDPLARGHDTAGRIQPLPHALLIDSPHVRSAASAAMERSLHPRLQPLAARGRDDRDAILDHDPLAEPLIGHHPRQASAHRHRGRALSHAANNVSVQEYGSLRRLGRIYIRQRVGAIAHGPQPARRKGVCLHPLRRFEPFVGLVRHTSAQCAAEPLRQVLSIPSTIRRGAEISSYGESAPRIYLFMQVTANRRKARETAPKNPPPYRVLSTQRPTRGPRNV